jgi:CRISPR-associated protein Cmr6
MAGSNPRPAVPRYLGEDFAKAAPGHRFYLYLPLWRGDWQRCEPKDCPGLNDKLQALARLSPDDEKRMKALAQRQAALARRLGDAPGEATDPSRVFVRHGTNPAPFTTGLGMEHPLENGFAFLTPYGLPYLPGSSVKGVLLQAARELETGGAFEDPDRDWNGAAIEALFGRAPEPATDTEDVAETGAQRGALLFWDVFPELPAQSGLEWEIMAPHQSRYLQDRTNPEPPHDNDPPTPIYFLTVPTGSGFHFYVPCNRALLAQTAPELLERDRWHAILGQLFDHAFDWLGFGAKTAVGYGAMATNRTAEEQEAAARNAAEQKREKERERAAMSPGERLAREFLDERSDPSQKPYDALIRRLDAGEVPEDVRDDFMRVLLTYLEERRREARDMGNKKKRDKLLDRLAADEERLKSGYLKE